jgi:HEAT repeat protein
MAAGHRAGIGIALAAAAALASTSSARIGVAVAAADAAAERVGDSPAEIARALDATHDPVRQKALIDRLVGMGAGPAAPALVRVLAGSDKSIRLAALAALWNIGVAAGPASVAPLIATLSDPDPDIRAAAARAFQSLGNAIWDDWVDHPEYAKASRAAQAAQQPLAALTTDARQPIDVRLQAATALAAMPVDASLAPTLAAALALTDDDVRVQICHALTRARARAAVPALEARLRDSSSKVQVAAAEALLAAGASKQAVPRLARLLVDSTAPKADRAKAGYVLYDHPADARPVLREIVEIAMMPHEHLIESMPSDGREDVRYWPRRAIPRIGAPAVPFLLPYLNPRSRADFDDQRSEAISALCGLGPAARGAVPAMMPLIASRDAQTRGDVASCLVTNIQVEPKRIAPKVLPLLSDRDKWVFDRVVHATKHLGPAAAPAVPRLRTLARDKDGAVRVDAIDTLAAIGAGAAPARPELEAGLTDAEERVQIAAALALVKTRIAPEVGLRRSLELLTSKDMRGWRGASYPSAPGRLGELASQPERQQVLAALVAALGTTNPATYNLVMHSIAAFGPDAAETALVPLTKSLSRPSYLASEEACAALASFGPKILPAVPALVQALATDYGPPARALLTTARRSPEVAAAVKAECAKTTAPQARSCRSLIRQIEAREEPPPAP